MAAAAAPHRPTSPLRGQEGAALRGGKLLCQGSCNYWPETTMCCPPVTPNKAATAFATWLPTLPT
eukprot:2796397-Amphidinium_carterae.1